MQAQQLSRHSVVLPSRRSRGFTLFELLMVVAILGIALTLGVPSLTKLIRDNRAQSYSNNLLGAVAMARSEAMRRGGFIKMCAVNDSTLATPTCSNSTDWATGGWMIFTDDDGGFRIYGEAGTYELTPQFGDCWGASNGSNFIIEFLVFISKKGV